MNAANIIQRIKARSAGASWTASTMPSIFADAEEGPQVYTMPPAPHQYREMEEGPGTEQLRELMELMPPLSLKFGPFLAGGAVRRILQGKAIDDGDVDLFFTDAADWLKFDKVLSSYELVHSSGKARTFMVNGLKVQIIKRKFYKDLGELFGDFDFSVCQVATDGKRIAYTQTALEDINAGVLRLAQVGRVSKLTVVGRMIKYINHGFLPEPGLFTTITESGLDIVGAHAIFDNERPTANYDHDAKVEEIMDTKVFDSKALQKAAAKLGLELPA